MSVKRFVDSFADAGRGLKYTFNHEQNFRIQIFLAIVVVFLTFIFPLKVWEIILLIVLVMTVLMVELVNTAIEHLTDLLKPRLHHYVLVVKDVMAAAVLVCSFGALVVGLIIFMPHFISLLK